MLKRPSHPHIQYLLTASRYEQSVRHRLSKQTIYTDLQEILEPDEMHMMAVIISDVVLTVEVGNELGEYIKTEVGIAQGDCLSAVLVIFT